MKSTSVDETQASEHHSLVQATENCENETELQEYPKGETPIEDVIIEARKNIGQKSESNHNKISAKIETHTSRQGKATYIKFIILIILMLWGIIIYTSRYLDTQENLKTNTETKKMEEIPLPIVMMKYVCSSVGCWTPVLLFWPENSLNLTNTSIQRRPTKTDLKNQGENTLCFTYTSNSIDYMVIIPPKSATLPINSEEYMGVGVSFHRNLSGLSYDYITEHSSSFTARMWVFDRQNFIKKRVNDSGLNAPIMIIPAHEYETTLQLTLKTRIWGFPKFGRKKRLKYDISFDGISRNSDCYDGISNDFDECYSIIYINPPSDNAITKIVKSKEYNFFDILSSVGGLYSLIMAILAFSCGCCVWGYSQKYFAGVCPYADTDDYILERKVKNILLKQAILDKADNYDGLLVDTKIDFKKVINVCSNQH